MSIHRKLYIWYENKKKICTTKVVCFRFSCTWERKKPGVRSFFWLRVSPAKRPNTRWKNDSSFMFASAHVVGFNQRHKWHKWSRENLLVSRLQTDRACRATSQWTGTCRGHRFDRQFPGYSHIPMPARWSGRR